MLNVGVIGLGERITTILKGLLPMLQGDGRLAAIVDTQTREELQRRHPDLKEAIGEAHFYDSAEDMLDKEPLDGVVLGTRCSTHARFARLVMDRGIPLFLEKPVATTLEDWRLLRQGYEAHDDQVVVSFPLRTSPIVQRVKEIVDNGVLGTIEHVQALNYVPYGGTYFHDWYRNEKETGGLFLQKATHDFDYINYILGLDPVQIAAMGSKRIFTGDRPADLKCVDCPDYRSCPESPYVRHHWHDPASQCRCCYATDTGNHDSASALVRYTSGMHVGYTQNFFARKHAKKRGAIFSGYEGTIEFDFYTLEIHIYPHHDPSQEIIRMDEDSRGHFGGDEALERNFIEIMRGGHSLTPLRTGLISALMCLKARESEQTARFCDIDFDA